MEQRFLEDGVADAVQRISSMLMDEAARADAVLLQIQPALKQGQQQLAELLAAAQLHNISLQQKPVH